VCVCVKWFCETCVFVLNVFVRFVCVCVKCLRFVCICDKWFREMFVFVINGFERCVCLC